MKILVVHTWGMGDFILATPMLRSLKESGHHVDLALTTKSYDVLLEENDFLENIYYIKSKISFIRFFLRYDILVSTTGMSVKKVKLLNFLIQAKKLYALEREKDVHRIKMNLKVVESLLTHQIKEPYIFKKENDLLIKKYLLEGKKNIGFAVGSGFNQKFKRWDKYAQLIQRFDANIILFIGPDEQDLKDKYRDKNVTIIEEELAQTVTLIASLDLLIGNDNGLMHIGYALDIPTVTIYAMTNEKESGGYREKNKAVFLDMDCRPCFDPSTDKVGCSSFECIKDLKIDEVYKVCVNSL
jgi:ADP-heptose:LPS heptosyltransferase